MTPSAPQAHLPVVGIDDMMCRVPRLCYSVASLAEKRGLHVEKLREGLGLDFMAIPDTYDDPATLGASAVRRLMEKNHLRPEAIGRLYTATESHFDQARPLSSYVLQLLAQYHDPQDPASVWAHCDAVDFTFACVAGLDALQNCLTWVQQGPPERTAVVLCSDIAKYPLNTPGEYTQGAGAVALLVRQKPRLMRLEPEAFAPAFRPAFDFYKPVRYISRQSLVEDILEAAGTPDVDGHSVLHKLENSQNGYAHFWKDGDKYMALHPETPRFDGPLSLQVYQELMEEALETFQKQLQERDAPSAQLTERWRQIAFHLPYARQGERAFASWYAREKAEALSEALASPMPRQSAYEDTQDWEQAYQAWLKQVRNSEAYRRYVGQSIEMGQRYSGRIGNMYTASVFTSLMSVLEHSCSSGMSMLTQPIGIVGYGSGAKAKVTEGWLQPGWENVAAQFSLLSQLREREEIDHTTYESLHQHRRVRPVKPPRYTFHRVSGPEEQPPTYAWQD